MSTYNLLIFEETILDYIIAYSVKIQLIYEQITALTILKT